MQTRKSRPIESVLGVAAVLLKRGSNPDSNRTDITCLSMGFNRNRACANRQIVRQPEDHFSEGEVSYRLDLLCHQFVIMIICIYQINNHGGSRLALCQLQIADK